MMQAPSECFCGGAGDGFVAVSATSDGRMVTLTSEVRFLA